MFRAVEKVINHARIISTAASSFALSPGLRVAIRTYSGKPNEAQPRTMIFVGPGLTNVQRTFRSSLEQIVEFSDVRPKEHDDLFSEVGQIENEPLLHTALLDDEHVNPFHHLEHTPGSGPLSRVTGLVGQRLVTFDQLLANLVLSERINKQT